MLNPVVEIRLQVGIMDRDKRDSDREQGAGRQAGRQTDVYAHMHACIQYMHKCIQSYNLSLAYYLSIFLSLSPLPLALVLSLWLSLSGSLALSLSLSLHVYI